MTKPEGEQKKDMPGQVQQPSEDWTRYFETKEQVQAVREMQRIMQEGFPWVNTPDERAREAAFLTAFPRTRFGKRQKDNLVRVLVAAKVEPGAKVEYPVTAEQLVKVTEQAATLFNPPDTALLNDGQLDEIPLVLMVRKWIKLFHCDRPWQPSTCSEFFAVVAEKLRYLERYRPTDGDFAIQALQEAFVGLMQREYDWKQNRYPTKGEVTAMAKAQLEGDGKSIKSGWTKHLQAAGLDWLTPGRAGRPTKAEVDENKKANKELRSKFTKFVNAEYQGDYVKALKALGPALGGKKEAMKAEEERLKEKMQPPVYSEEYEDEKEL